MGTPNFGPDAALGRLTSEEAAALYGVRVEEFIRWWMRGEVPFRRIREGGRTFFVLHDPARERALQGRRVTGDDEPRLPDLAHRIASQDKPT